MKVTNVYLNYSEKTKSFYYTLYLDNGEKIYLPYHKITMANVYFDKSKIKDE